MTRTEAFLTIMIISVTCGLCMHNENVFLLYSDAEMVETHTHTRSLSLSLRYTGKRDRLLKCLESIGLRPCKPEGGMFILSDISNVEFPSKYMEDSTPACPNMTR